VVRGSSTAAGVVSATVENVSAHKITDMFYIIKHTKDNQPDKAAGSSL
jgi:hypothetical protein